MKVLTRLALGACATLPLTATVAAPAPAINQDHHGGGKASTSTPPPTSPSSSSLTRDAGLDATSVALGALGGIALAGTGLGITLGVQRRRDRAALHTT